MRMAIRFGMMVLGILVLASGAKAQEGWVWKLEDVAPPTQEEYAQWSGMADVVNHDGLAYKAYGDRSDYLFFKGGTSDLNDFLETAAQAQSLGRYVEISTEMPTPRVKADKSAIDYSWLVRVDLSSWESQREKLVENGPAITVYVYLGAPEIEKRRVKIPNGFKVRFADEPETEPVIDFGWWSNKGAGERDKVVLTEIGVPREELAKAISDILLEMHALKVGMTRGDALKLFEMEGGISHRGAIQYVSRHCPYIKVNFEFEPAGEIGERYGYSYPETDIIKKMSRPYLEWSIGD